MKKTYTTAMGKKIDLQGLVSVHEETIAVGNMRVNARGDQLGPGGVVNRSRNAAIADHYQVGAGEPPKETREEKIQRQRMSGASMNKKAPTKISTKSPGESSMDNKDEQNSSEKPEATESNNVEEQETTEATTGRRLRGSLAGSLANETTVNQEKMPDPRRPKGPARIR